METIDFSMFVNYFTGNYFWILPIFCVVACAAILILDWMRKHLVAFIDDYEKEAYEWKLAKFMLVHTWYINQIGGRWGVTDGDLWVDKEAAGEGKRNSWSGTDTVSKYCLVSSREEAEGILNAIYNPLKINLSRLSDIVILTAGATIFHFTPLWLSITLVSVAGTVLLARGVVRLTKKIKNHINDPDAHKNVDEE